jgi:hypothetical protein
MGSTSAILRFTKGAFTPDATIDLTDDDVAEFRALHRRETGQALTDEQAREHATNLIRLVALVAKLSSRR